MNSHQTKYIVGTDGTIYNSITMHQLHSAVENRVTTTLLLNCNKRK